MHDDKKEIVGKRKRTVMGLDPHSIAKTSPTKRACKAKVNLNNAPAKLSGVR